MQLKKKKERSKNVEELYHCCVTVYDIWIKEMKIQLTFKCRFSRSMPETKWKLFQKLHNDYRLDFPSEWISNQCLCFFILSQRIWHNCFTCQCYASLTNFGASSLISSNNDFKLCFHNQMWKSSTSHAGMIEKCKSQYKLGKVKKASLTMLTCKINF